LTFRRSQASGNPKNQAVGNHRVVVAPWSSHALCMSHVFGVQFLEAD
jgi:hypothetical protein